jgi:hypothetical protein
MNKDVKEKWIKALTSGEYTQGKSYLRDEDDRYCCLGVLCDLYLTDGGEGQWEQYEDSGQSPWKILGRSGFLPKKVQEWAGLDCEEGWYSLNDDNASLTHMNDSGKTFAQIAEKIKEVL